MARGIRDQALFILKRIRIACVFYFLYDIGKRFRGALFSQKGDLLRELSARSKGCCSVLVIDAFSSTDMKSVLFKMWDC